jgi:hypothetical protein
MTAVWILEFHDDDNQSAQQLVTDFFSTADTWLSRRYGIPLNSSRKLVGLDDQYIWKGASVEKALRRAHPQESWTSITASTMRVTTYRDVETDNFDPTGTALGNCQAED